MGTLSRRLSWAAIACIALAAAGAPAAGAAPAAGITGDTGLATFDTATPSDVRIRPITGLFGGSEFVLGIDKRPATGELFILTVGKGTVASATIRTYRVDPATAVATEIGSVPGTLTLAGERPSGVDFNATVDRIRVVQSNNENGRINPNNGTLAGNDVDLTYSAPATGPVPAIAYDRNVAPGPPGTPPVPGAKTTVYGIDAGADRLVTIGGVDGSTPGGANGGTVASVGALGPAVVNTSDPGFDIAADGTAYAALRNAVGPALYTVNLATGTATQIGPLPVDLRSIALLDPDNCPLVGGGDQADVDGDGQGDACDADIDGDGVSNAAEQARGTDPRSADSDGDGVPDGSDACPTLPAAGGCSAGALDQAAPTITVTRAARRMKLRRFLAGVRPRVAVSEPARLELALVARARSARVARAGDIVLAERRLGLSGRTRSVRLRPKRSLVARSSRFRVRLRVTAIDAAGNRAVTTRTIRVRR